MHKKGIISLGEAIVDFISINHTNTKFKRFLGGATVNVAIGTRRLGVPSYYLCKLGTDQLSMFVEKELEQEQVNLAYSIKSSLKKMCSVYVHLDSKGERYFHSYINETPDEWLTNKELNEELFKEAKIFYFGSGTLFHPVSRKTTEQAIHYARKNKTVIAFDTNIRIKRWESEETCRNTIVSFLKQVDIAKLSADELLFLTNTKTIEEGLQRASEWKVPLLFLTMGKEGAYLVREEFKIFVSAIEVDAIDTTGAGDAFFSGVLFCVHEQGLPEKETQMREVLKFANQKGALCTTKMGAL